MNFVNKFKLQLSAKMATSQLTSNDLRNSLASMGSMAVALEKEHLRMFRGFIQDLLRNQSGFRQFLGVIAKS